MEYLKLLADAFELFIGCIYDRIANLRLAPPGAPLTQPGALLLWDDGSSLEVAQHCSDPPIGRGCPYAQPQATCADTASYPNFV